jgi:thiamine biosynthesis protein ThiS
MITITLNGKPAHLEEPMTVQQFLETRHKVHPRFVVVELRGEPLGRAEFPHARIDDGDVVEVVAPFGGG